MSPFAVDSESMSGAIKWMGDSVTVQTDAETENVKAVNESCVVCGNHSIKLKLCSRCIKVCLMLSSFHLSG